MQVLEVGELPVEVKETIHQNGPTQLVDRKGVLPTVYLKKVNIGHKFTVVLLEVLQINWEMRNEKNKKK